MGDAVHGIQRRHRYKPLKSRSEAAALFIREGLQVRGDELAELEEALQKVEKAKQGLRDKAKTVFGDQQSDHG